jgi:dolichyl-phosphate beta-glucosyltransferase
MSEKDIFLIVPCFNEAIRLNIDYWSEVAAIKNVKLVFVDDGSKDGTYEILKMYKSFMPCEVVTLSINLGKANAIRHGMMEVLADHDANYIGFLDCDGAFTIHDINRITQKWFEEVDNAEYTSLWASRVAMAGRSIERNPTRHYAGRILTTLMMFRKPHIAYDSQCGFKLFVVTDAFKSSLVPPFVTRWFFDLELFIRIKRLDPGYKIYEEPLNSWVDISGSKIKKTHFLGIIFEARKIQNLLSTIN